MTTTRTPTPSSRPFLFLCSLVLWHSNGYNGASHVMAKANDTTEPTCKADDRTCVEEETTMKVPRVKGGTTTTGNTSSSDEHVDCGLYVAESSIPNAGWGMYTAKPLQKGEQIGPLDGIFQVSDYDAHMQSRADPLPRWLMNEYYWNPRFGGASYEALDVSTIIPGLGMLANSHTGLVNSDNLGSRVQQGPSNRKQPETGAYSYHTELKFATTQELAAGMELFVAYGDDWFSDRSDIFGDDLPLSNDFEQADKFLKSFFHARGKDEFQWEKWRPQFENSNSVSPRIKKALPTSYKDALHVYENLKGSTAMHSVPNVIRPLNWLQEHGMCLDHMKMGPSTIEGAGKGAFASRNLPKGTIVSPAPVVHLHRGHLEVLLTDPNNKRDVLYKGHELLLNYVYGHPSTSLVFFPYAPATNLINHGSEEKTNVKLQWSSRQSHPEWLEWTTDQLLKENSKSGLMMEFVATRDIQEGEEILIDYGKDWEEAWKMHVQEWDPPANADTYTPAYEFNKEEVIRTVNDKEPYPANVMTACWIDKVDDPVEDSDVHTWLETDTVLSDMDYYRYTEDTHRCEVLERNGSMYMAQYEWKDEDDKIVRTKVSGIPRRAIVVVDAPYTADSYLRKAFRHYLELPNDMIPKPWRDLEKKEIPEAQCQLYMAESSIPNSGLGMYTAVDIEQHDPIFYPDLAVQVEDIEVNNRLRGWYTGAENDEPDWLLEHYYWNSQNTGSEFEASDIESIVPGLGMLANSHTGLVNAEMRRPEIDRSGMERQTDPGVGCSTTYHGVKYLANKDIPAGMELFVEYGDSWFEYRTEDLGLIPLSHDFAEADRILHKFWDLIDGKPDTKFAQDLWQLVWNNETHNAKGNRVRVALPKELSDVERVVEIGTAMYSVPNALRSPEWLEENGVCLDNIRPDKSTLPQAGHGAFATRFMSKGSIITPAPFVHIHRRHLEVMDSEDPDDETKKPWWLGRQLLLNYCYGNPKSNMLLFPYSPVTNYINHHHTDFNAELRWSSLPNHHSDWLKRSVEDLMTEDHAGVIMEIVATRDIEKGEEVLLDYGQEWELAWNDYIEKWQPPLEAEAYGAAADFNDYFHTVRTLDEEKTDPYPPNVRTACHVPDLKQLQEPMLTDDGQEQYEWRYAIDLYTTAEDAHPCDIVHRDEETPNVVDSIQPPQATYTARVHMPDNVEWVVHKIPRRAVEFYDDEYTSDLFLRQAFRHEIGIPDHMFPEAWKDLTE